MCIETILALFYFIILFIINLFLWRLLLSYSKNILFLNKIKRLEFSKQFGVGTSIYFLLLKENKIRRETFDYQNQLSFFLQNKMTKNKEDVLIIGNYYQYLKKNKNLQTSFEKLFSFQFLDNIF